MPSSPWALRVSAAAAAKRTAPSTAPTITAAPMRDEPADAPRSHTVNIAQLSTNVLRKHSGWNRKKIRASTTKIGTRIHIVVMPRLLSKKNVTTQPDSARNRPIPPNQSIPVRSLASCRLANATAAPATSMTRPAYIPHVRI